MSEIAGRELYLTVKSRVRVWRSAEFETQTESPVSWGFTPIWRCSVGTEEDIHG